MARTDDRGGRATKDRIAAAASRLFVERGFESVTVAQVAGVAGVSSVTVFKYFPKKEDLFFDRAHEISELFLEAVHGRSTRDELRSAIAALLRELLEQRHPLSGVDERSVGFFRTVARSPALIARARQLAAELQHRMTQELHDAEFDGDAPLVTAFLTAGYTSILVETATDLTDGGPHEELIERHRTRIQRLLNGLHHGVL